MTVPNKNHSNIRQFRDPRFYILFLIIQNFNPHTREGCDRLLPMQQPRHNHFNPHTREGCDWRGTGISRSVWISIHTPARGVTVVSPVSIEI